MWCTPQFPVLHEPLSVCGCVLGRIIILILSNIIFVILFLLYINQGKNPKIQILSITYPFLAPKGVHEKITNGLLSFILTLLGKN